MTPALVPGCLRSTSSALPWRPPELLGSGVIDWRDQSALCMRFRLRYEQVHSEPLRQEFRRELSLHAVAGRIERRRESPEAALARRDRDDAAADPALARQADVIEPVARGLVQAGRNHHRQRIVTD